LSPFWIVAVSARPFCRRFGVAVWPNPLVNALCDVIQWSCSVTQYAQSWHGFCSSPRTATWLTATLLSSRPGYRDHVLSIVRGNSTWMIQQTNLNVVKLFMPSNRSVSLVSAPYLY